MSYCQEFNCQHEKNGICSYSEEACVKEHCITFYAKCDACNCAAYGGVGFIPANLGFFPNPVSKGQKESVKT